METIMEFVERVGDLPLLRLYVHHAPHRRQHWRVIEAYRVELVAAAKRAGIPIPIKRPLALSVLFIDPTSPDLDNLVMSTYRALDGKGHHKASVLADDGLIECLEKIAPFFPSGRPRSFP